MISVSLWRCRGKQGLIRTNVAEHVPPWVYKHNVGKERQMGFHTNSKVWLHCSLLVHNFLTYISPSAHWEVDTLIIMPLCLSFFSLFSAMTGLRKSPSTNPAQSPCPLPAETNSLWCDRTGRWKDEEGRVEGGRWSEKWERWSGRPENEGWHWEGT